MAPPPSTSKSASARPTPASAKSTKDSNRPGTGQPTPDPTDPVVPDFSSLVPHHLDVLEGLPTNLRYLYSKITDLQHELDSQLDHLHASTTAIHASIRDRIVSTNYRAGVKVDMHMAANQAFSHLAGTTIQQCQRTAQRKVDLATYAYELVDRCVLKLDEELKAAGLPIQDAYPVILAAVSSSSGGSGASSSSAAAAATVAAMVQAQPPASPRKPAAAHPNGAADDHVSTGARSNRKRSRTSTPVSEHPTLHLSSSSVSSPEKPKKADKKQRTTAAAPVASSNPARKYSAQKPAKRKLSARDTPSDGGGEDADDGSSSDAAGEHFSTPVDPNEPLYCTCQSVAHGEMVACDDSDCPYEWFHYTCVGLTKAPKGQWYCSECSLKKKRQKKH